MILATLNMMIMPESRKELLMTIMGMLDPIRVERGCLSCRLYEDMENRNAFVLLEEWATQADLERHILADSQRQLLALMDLLSEPPELRYHTVSQTVGMDLIGNVLKADGAR